MKYLLLVTLGTALFFAAYWLLMRREKRFVMVRFYLLGTLVLSFVLPLVQLPLLPTQFNVGNSIPLRTTEYSVDDNGTRVGVESEQAGNVRIELNRDSQGKTVIHVDRNVAAETTTPSEAAKRWLMLAYGLGCGVMAIVLGVKLANLRKRLNGLSYRIEDGIRISELDDSTPAFSFGKHIVVGTRGFSPVEVRQLIGHEAVHVRRHHSFDLLLCELAKVALWFNPLVWFYQRELKRVHEYEADNLMLASESGAEYAELFYHQVSGKPFSPIGNTFDYGMVRSRISMIARKPTRRGWLKPMVALSIVAVMLLAGCKHSGSLSGTYAVEGITLMSDNVAEPALACKEFMGLENRVFCFRSDGRLTVYDQKHVRAPQECTYKIDENGLHLYDSTGNPWLDMTMETVSCDADSIVLRFVDPDPLTGLGKMLAGLPTFRYRVDTVQVSSMTRTVDGEVIEVSPQAMMDTVFAGIVVPCPYDNEYNWNRNNRLLSSATGGTVGVFYSQFVTEHGDTVSETGTRWEFVNNTLAPDARQRYDTTSMYNPLMKDDRFVLQVTLKPTAANPDWVNQ